MEYIHEIWIHTGYPVVSEMDAYATVSHIIAVS